jgi:two-component system phosphate regulon sensor histidine kinase PhoR
MFRRLFALFALLHMLILVVLSVAGALMLPQGEVRFHFLLLLSVLALVGLLVAGLLALSLSRRMGATLRDLSDALDRLGSGESTRHVFAPGRDELAAVSRAYNRMSDRLVTRIAQLEEDRQQLRTILSGMVEGVVALDADQRILFANDRALQLLEFPTRTPVGRRLWEVVRQRPLLDVVRRALEGPDPAREELGWSGSIPRSLTVHAARLPGPPPRGAVLVIHDTSELRRLERLRQDFVANVSHELKTPLSVIQAAVETLLDGAADEPQHRARFLEQIAGQTERLHHLILDLLSLARIESGSELFDFTAVAIGPEVEAVFDRLRARAEARQQILSASGPNGSAEPVAVWADVEAVEQILDNLLDNALKYTPEGGRIDVVWTADERTVTIEVRDTGIGIPAADLPRIFERFYRVDKARSRQMGGTGLGLAIVKHLTQAMHGTVRAASTIGMGTAFTITLPRAATTVEPEPSELV